MELQIERSADAASEISPEEMAPTVVPTNLYYASGVGVILFSSVLVESQVGSRSFRTADFFTAYGCSRKMRLIEELLDQAEALVP